MKARNVSVGVSECDGEIKVWCATFTLKGSLPKADGRVDEKARKAKQKEIAKVIEAMEFPTGER